MATTHTNTNNDDGSSTLFYSQLYEVHALSGARSGCLTGVVYVEMSQVRATKESYILHSKMEDTLRLWCSKGTHSLSLRIPNYTEPETTQVIHSMHHF